MTSPHPLSAIATPEGTFAVVALDQRGTLRRMFGAVGREDVGAAEMTEVKADIMIGLRGTASAFLIDPDLGMPAARSLGDGPGFGTLIAAEPSQRGTFQGEPLVHREPAQSAAWVRQQGGDAVKFLVQIRADRPARHGERDLTQEAVEVVREVVADCAAEGVPLVIENLIYPLNAEDELTPEQRADAIIEAAALLDDLEPTLLKLEYPGSPKACRRLAERLTRPWAVLSAGVPMEQFADALRVSCDEGGASGFIAGRAIWKDAVGMPEGERRAYLGGEGRRRLEECLSVIEGRARPFTAVHSPQPAVLR